MCAVSEVVKGVAIERLLKRNSEDRRVIEAGNFFFLCRFGRQGVELRS